MQSHFIVQRPCPLSVCDSVSTIRHSCTPVGYTESYIIYSESSTIHVPLSSCPLDLPACHVAAYVCRSAMVGTSRGSSVKGDATQSHGDCPQVDAFSRTQDWYCTDIGCLCPTNHHTCTISKYSILSYSSRWLAVIACRMHMLIINVH